MISQTKFSHKDKGFSIIEILVTIAIFSTLISVSVSVYQKINANNNLVIATDMVVESIRHSKNKAENNNLDSNWGVKLSNPEIVLFSGDSYNNRDSSNDRIFVLPRGIKIDGIEEIIFSKLLGNTVDVGEITLSNSYGNQILTINEYGSISYSSNSSPGVVISVLITNDWGTGYCADVTVSTDSATPITWTTEVPLTTYPQDGTVSSAWNTVWSVANNIMTASGVPQNETVISGAPVTFGYCADRNSTPPPAANVTSVVLITNDWGTGYCADVTVSTDSTTPITWTTEVPLTTYPQNGTISSLWNAVWSVTNNIMTASGVEWNTTVTSGSPATFGYCANR